MSTSQPDELDAVRLLVDTAKQFPKDVQTRIFRWAAEILQLDIKLSSQTESQGQNPADLGQVIVPGAAPQVSATGTDIKSFMSTKRPRNDVQFAAATAYFYRFEAPQAERKEFIKKDDLQEAARKASRERFADPLNTLNNAHKQGLLDKGTEKASFVINSVGENLVAMALPDGDATPKPRKPKKTAQKKASAVGKKRKKA